jgi:hypothetical protein
MDQRTAIILFDGNGLHCDATQKAVMMLTPGAAVRPETHAIEQMRSKNVVNDAGTVRLSHPGVAHCDQVNAPMSDVKDLPRSCGMAQAPPHPRQ